jgi:hypothetical protein
MGALRFEQGAADFVQQQALPRSRAARMSAMTNSSGMS